MLAGRPGAAGLARWAVGAEGAVVGAGGGVIDFGDLASVFVVRVTRVRLGLCVQVCARRRLSPAVLLGMAVI